MCYIEENDIDIAVVQETWLNRGDKNVYAEIKDHGFKILKQMRKVGTDGGGLAIIYKPQLDIRKTVINGTKDLKTFEFLSCNIQVKNKVVKLVNIYRLQYSKKHRFTERMFLDEFEQFLNLVTPLHGELVLTGDFNFHIEKESDYYSKSFLELLCMFNMSQLTKEPTHIKGGILDLVINELNLNTVLSSVEVDYSFRSDHYPVISHIPCEPIKTKPAKVLVRDYHALDILKFHDDLENCPLSDSSRFKDLTCSSTVELYNECLWSLIDKHCPLKEKTYREKSQKSKWFNDELDHMKRCRRQAERKLKKNPSEQNYAIYRTIRNHYNSKLTEARQAYYKKIIDLSKKDIKSLYKTLNKITGNVQERIHPSFASDQTIANQMTEFYSDKIKTIREEITAEMNENDGSNSHVENLYLNVSNKLSCFNQLSTSKLKTIISKMNNKSCQLDPIPTFILKQCIDILIPIILHIVNQSIKEKYFPQPLKHAVVAPIIKNQNSDTDTEAFKNYRPVSNLPFVSKLLEKVAFEEIDSHIQKNSLHGKYQSAYRKEHSCESAMFKVVGDLQKMVYEKNHAVLVLLDLSAAFDTIDHDILLKRLEKEFGITGDALLWIKSYLSMRTFSVCINGKNGKVTLLLYGVPQGSVLGPLLYILYTKELERIAKKHKLSINLYADDSQLYVCFTSDNVSDIRLQIESCLHEIKSWMSMNFLKLNEDKTDIIVFSPITKQVYVPVDSLNIKFENYMLSESDSVEILGTVLKSNLSFSSFISEKHQSCNLHLRNLRHIKKCLPVDVRIMLVQNLIVSKLDYCNSLLAASTADDLKPLQRTLNEAVRFIFDLKWNDHITPYFIKLHFLPVKFRILYKLCLLAYKIIDTLAPTYLIDTFKLFRPNTSIDLRIGAGRDGRMFANEQGLFPDKCIFRKLITTWNSLPFTLRTTPLFDSYKIQLKTYFFRQAYDV